MSTWMIVPSDDDLEHGFHKYIDKVMGPNGKWRYIYKKAKNKVEKAVGLDKRRNMIKAAKGYAIAEGRKQYLYGERNKLKRDNIAVGASITNEEVQRLKDAYSIAIGKNYEIIVKQKNRFEKAKDAYKKTLLGSIENVFNEGKKAFNNFLNLFKPKDTNKGSPYTPPYNSKNKMRTISGFNNKSTAKIGTGKKKRHNGTGRNF